MRPGRSQPHRSPVDKIKTWAFGTEQHTLARVLSKNGPLGVRAALDLLEKLSHDLLRRHAKGRVHGDITASKIVIFGRGSQQTVILLDADVQSNPGPFAAPEVHRCVPASVASDIYSLCATTYAAIAGRPPFDSENSKELSWLIQNAPSPPLRVVCAQGEAHPRLELLLWRGLSRIPSERPTLREVLFVCQSIREELHRPKRTRDDTQQTSIAKSMSKAPALAAKSSTGDEHTDSEVGPPRTNVPTPKAIWVGEELEREIARLTTEESKRGTLLLQGFSWSYGAALLFVAMCFMATMSWMLLH